MAEYVPTPITPTEPIPTETGTPFTYEQGERMIQLLTDNQGQNLSKLDDVQKNLTDVQKLLTDNHTADSSTLDQIKQLLTDIKSNTTAVPIDPSAPPTGITNVQAQEIINLLHSMLEVGGVILGAFALWFVIKWLYRFIGGVIFGGV